MTVTTNEQLCDKLFFKLLIKCPSSKVHKLFHHLVDTFCGQQNSYASYSDIYTLLEWWDLISSSDQFFKDIYSQDSGAAPDFELLPTEYQDVLKDVLDVRSLDLKNSLTEKSHAVSPAYLKSFDWKLKLTLASDKMSQLNEPRLLLDIDVTGDKLLQLDLNKDELKSLIETMEKAKKAVVDMMVE